MTDDQIIVYFKNRGVWCGYRYRIDKQNKDGGKLRLDPDYDDLKSCAMD